MQNILKDYQTWLILIVAIIIFFLLGFELYVFLALAITYFPVQWLSNKYPKFSGAYLVLVAYLIIFCLNKAHHHWLVNYEATDKTQQVCGILTKNEHHFLPLSPLNPANFIIKTSTEIKEFRTDKFRNDVDFRGLQLNQHICVHFVPADKSWLLLHDYIVKVEQS